MQIFYYYAFNYAKVPYISYSAEPEARIQISCKKLPNTHPDVVEIFADDMDYDDMLRSQSTSASERESLGSSNELPLRETNRVNRNGSTDAAFQDMSKKTGIVGGLAGNSINGWLIHIW